MERLREITEKLLAWYPNHRRDLPWRNSVTPYRVWISEIMLQQTRVEAVRGYFERFIARFPTVQDLANASEDELMKYWEGLGYYSRARNLLKAARVIVNEFQGNFPSRYEDIFSLPGIGAYTAGAIASIAFGLPTPAVDGNVLRVYSRVFADDRDVLSERVKKDVIRDLQGVYPTGDSASNLTQSLMELGATVCVPNGEPHCNECPLAQICLSKLRGEESLRPNRKAKSERKVYQLGVFLLRAGDRIAVEKRKEKGVLFDQYQFPCSYGEFTVESGIDYLVKRGAKTLTPIYEKNETHVFTHVLWKMKAFAFLCNETFGDFRWVSEKEIQKEIALPSAFRKFLPF